MTYDQWKTRDPNDTGFYDMPEDDGPTELDMAYAEIERLRKLVKGGLDAINAAICQTQAEQLGHDRTADKYCMTVEQWRKDARAVLTPTHPPAERGYDDGKKENA